MEKTDNELIAEFMGWRQLGNPPTNSWGSPVGLYPSMILFSREFYYDSNWNLLMPVVAKIFEMKPVVLKRDKSAQIKIALIKDNLSITNVYKEVVEFIKWYNSLNSKTT